MANLAPSGQNGDTECLLRRINEEEVDLGENVDYKDASEYVTGQTLLVDGGISTGATRATPRR